MHKHFLYFLYSFAIIGCVQTFNVENKTINTKLNRYSQTSTKLLLQYIQLMYCHAQYLFWLYKCTKYSTTYRYVVCVHVAKLDYAYFTL